MTVDPFDQLSGPADERGGSLQGRTARGLWIPDDVFFSHDRRDFLEAYRNFERGQGQPDTSPLLVGGNHESSETLPPKGIACGYQITGIPRQERITGVKSLT